MANVRLKNVRTGKQEEMSLKDFLKIMLGELPSSDKVNDEVSFKSGEPLYISSLEVDLKA